MGLQLKTVEGFQGEGRGLLGRVDEPGVEPGQPQQDQSQRTHDRVAAHVRGGMSVFQMGRAALRVARAAGGEPLGHQGECGSPGVTGGVEQLRRALGPSFGLGDVPEFGGGDRVDGQTYGQAPSFAQRLGHLDQLTRDLAGPAELT